MQETQEKQVWSLRQEDRLEKEMATHSIILAWKIPLTEELAGYSSWGHTEAWLSTYTHTRSPKTLPLHEPDVGLTATPRCKNVKRDLSDLLLPGKKSRSITKEEWETENWMAAISLCYNGQVSYKPREFIHKYVNNEIN